MYKSLHDYIKDTSTNLGFDVQFFHGDLKNAQQIPVTESINCYLLPMISSGTVNDNIQVLETYTINIFFYMKDRVDSGINRNNADVTQDEIKILEATSTLCDVFLRKFIDNDINANLQRQSDLLKVNSFAKTPAIKDTSKFLTGHTLNISANITDSFDYCCL